MQAIHQRSQRSWGNWLILAGGIIYLGSYALLSSLGQYVGHNQGGADNRITWVPAYCGEKYVGAVGRAKLAYTAIGWFFLPLIVVDQCLVHPTRDGMLPRT